MALPGFTAEASIGPTQTHYRALAAYGSSNAVVPASATAAACWAGCMIPCLTVVAGWPMFKVSWAAMEQCNRICSKNCRYLGYVEVPPGILFRPIALGPAGTAAVALAAVAVGVTLGYFGGTALDDALAGAEGESAGTIAKTCTTTGRPHVHQTTGDYWGCKRSFAKTMTDANEKCWDAQTCAGGCSAGAGQCVPQARLIDSYQIPGITTCETTIFHTCECECVS